MLCSHLRDCIVIPTLRFLGDRYLSDSAINLLLGTCAQESNMGEYLKQLNNGPALGIYQIEPKTHIDIYENYLQFDNKILEKITKLLINFSTSNLLANTQYYEENLIGNLYYATAIARICYWRHSESLPKSYDTEGLARYWKKYYNTDKGKGTVAEFVNNFNKYVINGK